MDIARMEPEGYLTTTVPPIKQTNKQERTEAEAWKQILEKRVSKFFNKATAPVNRYVKFQKLSSFKTVETRNSVDIFHHEFWFEYCWYRTLLFLHCCPLMLFFFWNSHYRIENDTIYYGLAPYFYWIFINLARFSIPKSSA